MPFDENTLLAERDKHQEWLNQQAGIAGTGIGVDSGGQLAIKIFTNHMSKETKQAIESRLASLPVDFEETGEFRAF
jgi:hypothetical protein